MTPFPSSAPHRAALLAGLLVCILTLVPAGAAEPVYVRDRLLVALREAPAADAAPVALLVSGTELTVLERQDGFARVRTADGKEGWLELAYLSTDLPAERVIARLERENEALKARLAGHAGEDAGRDGGEALQQLREELASERLRNAELQARLTEALRSRPDGEPQDAPRLAELEAENRELRAALERRPAGAPGLPGGIDWRIAAAALALVLLAGFAAGAWFVDWRARRRHGGFRV